MLSWYKSTNTDAEGSSNGSRYTFCLLYWYQSTNTDAKKALLQHNYRNAKGRVQFANVAVTDPTAATNATSCEMLRVPAALVDTGEAPD